MWIIWKPQDGYDNNQTINLSDQKSYDSIISNQPQSDVYLPFINNGGLGQFIASMLHLNFFMFLVYCLLFFTFLT